MIWTLRVECIRGMHWKEECVRVIEIESSASIYDLHYAIQRAVQFDNDHGYQFYSGRAERNRAVDIGYDYDDNIRITLDSIYPLPKYHKLFYWFDFGDDWIFEIRKSRKKPRDPEPGVSYPRVVEAIGPNPEQCPDTDEGWY